MSSQPTRGHRANLRKGRVSIPGAAYFITKCALDSRTTVLRRDDCAEIVHSSLLWAQEQAWWRVLCFVVMPNHYHLIVGLGDTKSLDTILASVSKFTARQINTLLNTSGSFWEESFYDHAIRDREDFDTILQYVHQNPVEVGCVNAAEDWEYSTASSRFSAEIDWDWIGTSMKSIQSGRRFHKEDIPYRYW